MEYKQLLKKVQTILENREQYTVQTGKHNAISTDVPTLIAVRSTLRMEMNKIVEAVDVLARDPGILKRQMKDSSGSLNPLIKSIILEAQCGRYNTHFSSPLSVSTTAIPPTEAPTTESPPTEAPTSEVQPTEVPAMEVSITQAPTMIHSTPQPSPSITFDFDSLVAPEIWADLLHVPKEGVISAAVVNPDKITPLTSGFPPPPSVDHKPEPKSEIAPPSEISVPQNAQSAPPPEPAKLKIHAASWGGVDITQYMSRFVDADQILTIDTNTIAQSIPDPWWMTKKSLTILFQYTGSGFGLLITSEFNGVQKITPTSMTDRPNVRQVGLSPQRRSGGLYIIAVVWGDEVLSSPAMLEQIYSYAQSKQQFPVTSSFFGVDTWPGIQKSCHIYYQDVEGGPVKWALGREKRLRDGIGYMQFDQ